MSIKERKTIDVTVGIFNSEYTLYVHDDGHISLMAPYIRWSGNNGNLAFRKINIDESDKADVMAFFENDELVLPANNNCGVLSLEDIINGQRYPDVHVTIGVEE